MALNVFKMLELINSRLSKIESNIARIDEKLDFSINLQRNHLIRVKHGEDISDDMILHGRPYNDLSPDRAMAIYNNPDGDFLILDVSKKFFEPPVSLSGRVHIPLEDLSSRVAEITTKVTPIMVISELGIRSIQACEQLIKAGYFNVNNISGGYRYLPKDQSEAMPPPPLTGLG